MKPFEHLEWVHPLGTVFKPTYDEADDWALTPQERQTETVRRIRNFIYALECRIPETKAA